MSETLFQTSSEFNKNLSQIKILPHSSNVKVNELLGVSQVVPIADESGAHSKLKSIVKKSGRHNMKKSIWSEYVKNQTKKNVKFNSFTRVMRYDDGVRGTNETLEDLMTETDQQNKNSKYRKIDNVSYQHFLKALQKNSTWPN